jgi:hypothetical protein
LFEIMNNLFVLVHLMLVARQGHMTRTNSIEVAHEAISLWGWPSLQTHRVSRWRQPRASEKLR